MKKSGRKFLFLILVGILLVIPAGAAFAKELGMMTISGPGIAGEMTVKGPIDIHKLEEAGFFEAGKTVKPPEGLAGGYLMTLFLNLEEGLQPWLQVTYYPSRTGESGYFNVVDLMSAAPKGSTGQWYQADTKAELALRDFLTEAGVPLAAPAAGKDGSAAPAPQVELQPAVSAPKLEQAAPVAPGQEMGPARVGIAINSTLVWGISLSAVLLLAFLSLRWVVAQRKINI